MVERQTQAVEELLVTGSVGGWCHRLMSRLALLWREPALPAVLVGLLVGVIAWNIGWPTFQAAGGPVEIGTPHVALSAQTIDVSVRLTTSDTLSVNGWFYLGRIGDATPWEHFAYQSTGIDQHLLAGVPAEFHWHEPLTVPADRYEVTLWFHKRVGNESVHLAGGRYGIPPLTLGNPVRLHEYYGGAVARLDLQTLAVTDAHLEGLIVAHAAPGVHQLSVQWRLQPTGNDDAPPAYSGRAQLLSVQGDGGNSAMLHLVDDLALPGGTYDLWLDANAAEPRGGLAQKAVYRGAITLPERSAFTRQQAVAGAYRLRLAGPLADLHAGAQNDIELGLIVTTPAEGACRVAWRLLTDTGTVAAEGRSDAGCEGATLVLPNALDPGRYHLELSAYAGDGAGSLRSDTIFIDASVVP